MYKDLRKSSCRAEISKPHYLPFQLIFLERLKLIFAFSVAVELNKLVQVKNSGGSLDFLGSQALSSTLSSGAFQLPLASSKVSSASPSAAGSVAGGPASVVSSGPDSVSSNPCVITGEGASCDLNLISAMKSNDGTPLTPRDGVGQSASVPGSNASGNTDSPAPEVGVEHMDWTKIELPPDLAGNNDVGASVYCTEMYL